MTGVSFSQHLGRNDFLFLPMETFGTTSIIVINGNASHELFSWIQENKTNDFG